MLEILSSLNESIHIPPQLRYDLELPGPKLTELSLPSNRQSDGQKQSHHFDVPTAQALLRDATSRLLSQHLMPADCRELENRIASSDEFAPAESYAWLIANVPHQSALPVVKTENGTDTNTHAAGSKSDDTDPTVVLGFLTPEEESAAVAAIDAPNALRPGDGLVERERDAALRNPVSVYNWMRKHQAIPGSDGGNNAAGGAGAGGNAGADGGQVDTHSKQPAAANVSSRSNASRASKRASLQAQAVARKEEDLYDEDGILIEAPTSAPGGGRSGKRKRERDEDGGYRPKGGTGGRGSKKRKDKEEGGASGGTGTGGGSGGTSKRSKRTSAPGQGQGQGQAQG